MGKGIVGFLFMNFIKKIGITKKAAPIAKSEKMYSQPWNSVHVPQFHLAGQLSARNSFSKNSVICSNLIIFIQSQILQKKSTEKKSTSF